jgi:hypothetical protein
MACRKLPISRSLNSVFLSFFAEKIKVLIPQTFNGPFYYPPCKCDLINQVESFKVQTKTRGTYSCLISNNLRTALTSENWLKYKHKTFFCIALIFKFLNCSLPTQSLKHTCLGSGLVVSSPSATEDNGAMPWESWDRIPPGYRVVVFRETKEIIGMYMHLRPWCSTLKV